jgi:hypothetical protein
MKARFGGHVASSTAVLVPFGGLGLCGTGLVAGRGRAGKTGWHAVGP